jgi:hypothetical protein
MPSRVRPGISVSDLPRHSKDGNLIGLDQRLLCNISQTQGRVFPEEGLYG